MKTTQKFIIGVIVIFSYSFCHAQMAGLSPLDASNTIKRYSKNVNVYIFEGHVVQIKEKEMAMSDMGNELVCFVVQITKIYKGSPQLKLGTIKVLSGYFQSRGEDMIAVFDDRPRLTGGKHIIFGKLSNLTAFGSITTDNSFTLWAFDYIDFGGDPRWLTRDEFKKARYRGPVDSTNYIGVDKSNPNNKIFIYRPAAKWLNLEFPTLDSLHSFFKNNGLEVQEEVQPQEVAPEDSVKQK